MAEIWVCEYCGWTCPPTSLIPLDEVECDNCGEPLTAEDDDDA